jgi:hypothetical protein
VTLIPVTRSVYCGDLCLMFGNRLSWNFGRLVLFVDRRCEKCTLAEKALLEAATEQQPIPALVCFL